MTPIEILATGDVLSVLVLAALVILIALAVAVLGRNPRRRP